MSPALCTTDPFSWLVSVCVSVWYNIWSHALLSKLQQATSCTSNTIVYEMCNWHRIFCLPQDHHFKSKMLVNKDYVRYISVHKIGFINICWQVMSWNILFKSSIKWNTLSGCKVKMNIHHCRQSIHEAYYISRMCCRFWSDKSDLSASLCRNLANFWRDCKVISAHQIDVHLSLCVCICCPHLVNLCVKVLEFTLQSNHTIFSGFLLKTWNKVIFICNKFIQRIELHVDTTHTYSIL